MPISANDDPNLVDQESDLVVSGAIFLDHGSDIAVEVKRGMVILTNEGLEAGRVAAVTINREDHQATHILLSRLIQVPEYRLVPISEIEQVHDETVRLRIFNQVVNTLPTWHGS